MRREILSVHLNYVTGKVGPVSKKIEQFPLNSVVIIIIIIIIYPLSGKWVEYELI